MSQNKQSSIISNTIDPTVPQSQFADLLRRVCQGDAAAAEELVRRYESDLRVIARARLFDPRLRQLFDSIDVCQSIFGQFFLRAYAGQFDVETPEQLKKVLAAMVRNKITDYARHYTAQRRDVGREVADATQDLMVGSQRSILSQIAGRDLIDECRNRMTSDEALILDRRLQDQSWDQIAHELGANADAVRKKFVRALDRIADEMELRGNDEVG